MKLTAVLCTAVCGFAATVAQAAATPNAAAHARAAAPYLDDQSYVVVRIDLSKLNISRGIETVNRIAGVRQDPQNLREAKKLDRTIAALREQKVNEFLLIQNLADLPRSEPTLIVPVDEGGNHHTVAALMFSQNPDGPTSRESAREFGRPVGSAFELCTRLGDTVFCGSRRNLDRLKSLNPVKRPELVKAFEAAGDGVAQILVLPGRNHRRVISEMLPELPQAVGGGTGADLVDELQWAALGVTMPPKLSVRLTVQSKNAAAAKSLHKRAVAGLAMLSRLPQFNQLIMPTGKARQLLTPKVDGSRLTLNIDAEGENFKTIVAMFAAPIGQARSAAQRAQSQNNLKQIGLALHNFHATYRSFPPHASYNKKGKKLLSWRVFLLPYLEQKELFNQFRLNEPWDSEHNKKLIARMPMVFADPTSPASRKKGLTRYLAPVGPDLIFTGKPEGTPIRDILDGTSNTILVVEATPKSAVIWTKPDDLDVDLKKPKQGIFSDKAKGTNCLFADGSVRFLAKSLKLKTLAAMLTRKGREVINE